MKKSAIEKIEKEIVEKTKLPNEVKENIKKEVFNNIAVASVIILYLIFIFLGSVGTAKIVRTIDLNIFSILFLGIAIILFEISYRKDDGKLAMFGIESLVIAIFTLFLPYIIFELNEANKKYYLISSIYIAAYYILKSIIISVKLKSKYMNSNISDVKEIVKKEKTKRRIKEDIEEIEVKGKNNKNNLRGDANSKPKSTKRGRPKISETTKTVTESKKETTIKNGNENIKEETVPKKRGRPKKVETSNNENKPKEETTPKKRGRPRKVVSK